jgi:hypothetical protein
MAAKDVGSYLAMIYRTIKNAANPYFTLDRTAINDERLSYKAIGIYACIMAKPDNWEANEADITSRHADGKAAVRSGVQELLQYGYMTRVQIRKDKKIVGWRIDTYESPSLNPHYQEGKPVEYVVEHLDSDFRNLGKLDSDFQDVGNQDVGNRNSNKYIKKEINEGSKAPTPPTDFRERLYPLSKKSIFYHDDWRAAYLPVFERLVDVYRIRPLIDDVEDEKAISALQRIAIDLAKMRYDTVEAVNHLERQWYAIDFRGKKGEAPKSRQFVEFAATQKTDTPAAIEYDSPRKRMKVLA